MLDKYSDMEARSGDRSCFLVGHIHGATATAMGPAWSHRVSSVTTADRVLGEIADFGIFLDSMENGRENGQLSKIPSPKFLDYIFTPQNCRHFFCQTILSPPKKPKTVQTIFLVY